MSFDRAVDARIEFRFGLFADNSCRLRDGLDDKALGFLHDPAARSHCVKI
jgi:hypothetical protein